MHFLDPPWNFHQQWLLLEIWSSQPPAMQEWEEIPQHTGIWADQERLIVWKTLSWCNHRLEAQASQKSYRPPGLWVSPAGWSLSLPLRIWENPAWSPINSHWVSVLPTCKTLSTISKLSTVLWKEKKSQDAEEPTKYKGLAFPPPRRMKRRPWADSIPTLRHLHDVWGSVSPKNSCCRGGGSKMLKHQAAGCPHWKDMSLCLWDGQFWEDILLRIQA